MALKRLTNHEIFGLIEEWLGALRPVLAEVASVAHLLPHLEAIHDTFLSRPAPPDDEHQRVRKAASALDIQHDATLRTAYELTGALAGYAELREPGAGAALAALREDLWPAGLMHNARTYFEEGSHAVATGKWLAGNPEARATAAAVSLPDGKTLLDLIERWIAIGQELLTVERTSQDLAAARDETPGSNFVDARNQFIRVVEAMRRNLALDASVSDETRARLLNRVDTVERNADRKRRERAPDPGANPQVPEPEMDEASVAEGLGETQPTG